MSGVDFSTSSSTQQTVQFVGLAPETVGQQNADNDFYRILTSNDLAWTTQRVNSLLLDGEQEALQDGLDYTQDGLALSNSS